MKKRQTKARQAKGSGLSIVLSTIDSQEKAAVLGRALVERGLAACVNIIPGIRSIYPWQGKIEDQEECLLLLKTRTELYPELQAALKELHPYEVPEIIAWSAAEALPAYRQWVEEVTRAGKTARARK